MDNYVKFEFINEYYKGIIEFSKINFTFENGPNKTEGEIVEYECRCVDIIKEMPPDDDIFKALNLGMNNVTTAAAFNFVLKHINLLAADPINKKMAGELPIIFAALQSRLDLMKDEIYI